MKILIIVASLWLTACSSMPGMSSYSFTNAELETLLVQQLPKLSKKINLMGMPIQFDVNDVNVNIGPDNRDVVALGLDSSAEVNAFSFKYPVSLQLQIEGSPFYDGEKKAIFLRDVKLLDSSIDAGGFKGNLGLLNGEAMRIINTFLADNPVYTLDMNNPKMALLSKFPLNIQVVEGAIKIVPLL